MTIKELKKQFIEFQKEVAIETFGLKDENGNYDCSFKKNIIWIGCYCTFSGAVFYFVERIIGCFVDGYEMERKSFLKGFFWPLISIFICTISGMPICLIGKKDDKLAKRVDEFGVIIVPVVYSLVKGVLQSIFWKNKKI